MDDIGIDDFSVDDFGEDEFLSDEDDLLGDFMGDADELLDFVNNSNLDVEVIEI